MDTDIKRCPNCKAELNNDELAAGKCFTCNGSFTSPISDNTTDENIDKQDNSTKNLDNGNKFKNFFFKNKNIILGFLLLVSVSIGLQSKYEPTTSVSTTKQLTTTTIETTTETTTIALVSYSDIKSGACNDMTVNIEGVISNIASDSFDISIDAWFKKDDKIYDNNMHIFTDDNPDLYKYITENLSIGDSCIFTTYVHLDASFGTLLAVQKLDKEQITLNDIKQMYISGCVNINASELARNPSQYARTTDVKLSGKIRQVIDETQFMLDTGTDNGLVNFYYTIPDSDPKILEGDYITIYGTFTHTYDYVSVLGSKKSVPSVVCKFIDY